MPDCVAVAIHTPRGVVMHTGDFKIDQTPLDGEHVDFHRLARARRGGRAGAARRQHQRRSARASPARSVDVIDAFEEIFTSARGQDRRRDVRVEHLPDADPRRPGGAVRSAASRSSAAASIDNSRDRAAARLPARSRPACRSATATSASFPAQDVVCICTGSQGEPQAALPRIAIDDHRHVKLDPDDVVVFSAREIPGNEKAIGRVMNHIARRGAEVDLRGHQARPRVRARQRGRAEAHAFAGQAALLRADTRGVPPARPARPDGRHGCRRARRCCWRKTATSSGSTTRGRGSPDKVPAGRILIDGTRSGEVGDEVLRDRRHLAGDGLVVPVVAIGRQSGDARGDAGRDYARVRARRAHRGAAEGDSGAAGGDASRAPASRSGPIPGLIKEKIRVDLQRFFRKRSGLRPLVLPVVMEI